MSVIILDNISFAYPSGSEPVFDHLSFFFDSTWKTGIIGRNGKGKTTLFRLLMHQYFDRELFERDISSCSFGQKKKTVIAVALCQQSHLYNLDEPLNDIDLFSRIQIEEPIAGSDAAFIIVEHDQAF
ncbi:MAG: ATP-binding cassette domain-containing protein [Bulleidia sp.]